MTRDLRAVTALSAVLFALVVPGCKGKKSKPPEKRSDRGTLTANAGQVLDELGSLETKKDVTCWTSFRQLDWFIAEKSYSEFGTLAKIAELGGTIAVPKMPVPGMGWLAYVKDPDGNIVGMMQMDPSAK